MEENLMYFGDQVKALGEGKVGGYLVRYGNPNEPDLTGDFFTKDTDLGVEEGAKVPVYYEHGYDSVLKMRKIGRGVVKFDDIGAWLDAQLEMRDDYERMLYQMAEEGKLGWSSGAAGHLVEREQVGKSCYIKSWVIAEASLTPQPAEPRNSVVTVKSIYSSDEVEEPHQEVKEIPSEEATMPEEIKEVIDVQAIAEAAAEQAVKKYAESQPQVKAGYVEVIEDETDKAVKSFPASEFFMAVKNAAMYPSGIDKRLLAMKATGLNEGIPSQGGFIVPPLMASGILENMWGVGKLLSYFKPVEISSNNMTFNAIDETSRAAGSRSGGIRGYWLAEAAQKTASKPSFRQVDLKLKKVAALCYATDELLDDATALESWITREVPNELRFMVEDSFINGTGIGMPLGIIPAGCLVSATRTDEDEIDALDLGRMWAARYPGANDYIWLINTSVMPQLFSAVVGQSPVYMPPGGLSGAMYGSIFGRPVIETEYNPYLGTLGDILLVSPSQYLAITNGGIQSASSIHVKFDYDETCFRFVYRVDGQPAWASAVTAFDGAASISPFVALAATT
jgi:HK97 family phage major capsid protein